jgi:crotonobetainyl-CoA:carnitine CoA-transferase CaiB-like acyl-CoA transferase
VARGFFEPLELPTLGEHLLPTWPFRSRWTARWARTPAPSFGEHHDEVLSELGLDDRARADLLARGIITNAPSGA